jgi:hypothetical protein
VKTPVDQGGKASAGTGGASIGRISHLDKSVLLKLQAGCNYINDEIRKARGRVLNVTIICLVLGAALYAHLWRRNIKDPRLPIGGAAAVALLYATMARRELAKKYKSIVVTRVVSALGQGLTYSPSSRFTKQDFLDMDLFEKRCEKWHAEDEICGKKGAVSYSILEAKATRTEGSGKNRRTVTIFKGLIIRLDFNKNFGGHTVVVPDAESKILGGLFGESESRRRKDIARLENVDFEKIFSVYCTDQQEARYLLTPKMMELIMEAQTTLGVPIRLSFHDNSVFLTVPQNADRFEVRMFGAKVSPELVVGDLAEVVRLAERLVEALELETRIWSRV